MKLQSAKWQRVDIVRDGARFTFREMDVADRATVTAIGDWIAHTGSTALFRLPKEVRDEILDFVTSHLIDWDGVELDGRPVTFDLEIFRRHFDWPDVVTLFFDYVTAGRAPTPDERKNSSPA